MNDEFQEPDIEQFTVSASTADASVSIENATAVVFIFDDDSKFSNSINTAILYYCI